MPTNAGVLYNRTDEETAARENVVRLLRASPIPNVEISDNIGLYITRQNLSRIVSMHEIYKKIMNVSGVVMEFGVRWGQNMSLFQSFRGMYEPFNHSRTIIGFDTFEGFPEVDAKDGAKVNEGGYSVTENYEAHLDSVLSAKEILSPIAHKKKYKLVKGDATKTVPDYMEKNPETIVALAYFDFDIYAPTKACLKAILPRVTKGSILAFDELNHPTFPGETLAVMETLGLSRYALQRSPLDPFCSYLVID